MTQLTNTKTLSIPETIIRYNDFRGMEIDSHLEAATVLHNIFPAGELQTQERWYMLAMDVLNGALGYRMIHAGNATPGSIDISFLLTAAAFSGAEKVILARNNPVRSKANHDNDMEILRLASQALELLGISLIDFIVLLDRNKFISFADPESILKTGWLPGYN